ncbi:helix-turn-helix domain-containing transcriptional regulator [Rhodanobacter sp. UC4450_H17]
MAEAAGLTRAGLYEALSSEGNPSPASTMKMARALGYRLSCCLIVSDITPWRVRSGRGA